MSGPSGRSVLLAFAAVVAAFFAANLSVGRASTEIAGLSASISRNTALSIERLGAARRAVLEAELALVHAVEGHGDPARYRGQARAQLASLQQELRVYLELPPDAGEPQLKRRIEREALDFESAVLRGLGAELPLERRGREALEVEVARARVELLESVSQAVALNASFGRAQAARILDVHKSSQRLNVVLNGVSGALALVAAWLVHRQIRERHRLAEAYARNVEARAEELEQFAGRVAHDIRNPLSSASLAAQLAQRRSSEPEVKERIGRSLTNLGHASDIVGGLLQFARAGARPDPGARTDVKDTLEELLAELGADAARAGIELRLEEAAAVWASCSPGVYVSLVSNLVRNAIRYMDEGPVRRICVRARAAGDAVTTEVEDTGPGIKPEDQHALFDPYFRGSRKGRDGLGLGLATVKKLAEGHGGRAGVRSVPKRGSTFWFTLPLAGRVHPEERAAELAPETAPH